MEIRKVVDCKNLLGEGPLWDTRDQRLYWVDSIAKEIWSCREDGSDTRRYFVPYTIGSMALRDGGGAVLAMANGFSFYDFETQKMTPIGDPEVHQPLNRFNDGKVDRAGRFFAGYMGCDFDALNAQITREMIGGNSLYRLDPDLSIHCIDTGIGCSNAPCWSPDDKTFYFGDSNSSVMWAYDYDIATGEVSNKRTFFSDAGYPYTVDGATVDSEGFVWNAKVFGGRIIRYAPDGSIDRVIDFPLRSPTSVMFGGENLNILYVTSMAKSVLGVPQTEAEAGAVYAIYGLGVKGLPEPRFAG